MSKMADQEKKKLVARGGHHATNGGTGPLAPQCHSCMEFFLPFLAVPSQVISLITPSRRTPQFHLLACAPAVSSSELSSERC